MGKVWDTKAYLSTYLITRVSFELCRQAQTPGLPQKSRHQIYNMRLQNNIIDISILDA